MMDINLVIVITHICVRVYFSRIGQRNIRVLKNKVVIYTRYIL